MSIQQQQQQQQQQNTPPEGQQQSGENWLPESLRGNDSLTKFKDVDSLATSYLNLEKMNTNSIRIPTESADEEAWGKFYNKFQDVKGMAVIPSDPNDAEAWNAFYTKMGRPEKKEDYSVGDDLQREFFHEAGITESQARFLAAKAEAVKEAAAKQHNDTIAARVDGLKDEWGEGFDRNFSNAKLAATKLVGEAFADRLANPEDPLSSDTDILKLLASIGGGDSQSVPLDASSQGFNLSKPEIESHIADLRNNEAYANGEQWAVKKMRELYTQLGNS